MLHRLLSSHHIPLNISKRSATTSITPNLNLALGPISSLYVQLHSEPILGCPTGSTEFRQTFAFANVDAATASFPALTSLQPWTTWNLFRCDCASRHVLATWSGCWNLPILSLRSPLSTTRPRALPSYRPLSSQSRRPQRIVSRIRCQRISRSLARSILPLYSPARGPHHGDSLRRILHNGWRRGPR